MTCRFILIFFILWIFVVDRNICSKNFPPKIDHIDFSYPQIRSDFDIVQRIKRDSASNSFKISVHFDVSVKKLKKNQQVLIKNAVEKAADFWSKAIRPKYKLNDRIRLSRRCTSRKIYIVKNNYSIHYCSEKCSRETFCGDVVVPDEHLQQCYVCNELKNCEQLGDEGRGVDAEFILYVSAKDTDRCQPTDTLATASFCQLDFQQDRPIAGNVNVCPRRFSSNNHSVDFDGFVSTIKHEILHTLVFSSGLFAFFRDAHGEPLTERDPSTRWPKHYDENSQVYIPSKHVLKKFVRNNWLIRSGTMTKIVSMIVTPKVQEVVREHFSCPHLEGAELEDQGNLGTALTHWEKRLFEHEIMTGTYTQESIISNLTLALLEDSGWYDVSYEYGRPLLWGRALGCDFVMKSCKQWIDNKLSKGESPHPFCVSSPKSMLQKRTCAYTYDKIVMCNLIEYSESLPAEYQIFDSLGNITDDEVLSRIGGHVALANYCPYDQELSYQNSHRDSRCYRNENQPSNEENYALEKYSSSSRCFDHASVWEQYIDQCRRKRLIFPQTAGCYQFDCLNSQGISIKIGQKEYLCEYQGQNLSFTISQSGSIYVGSIICPDCQILCGSIVNFRCPSNRYRPLKSFESSPNTPETIGDLCYRVANMALSDKNQFKTIYFSSIFSITLFSLSFYFLSS